MAHYFEWNRLAWESGVPADFIAQHKDDALVVIESAWNESLPIEYARGLHPAYSQL